MTPSTSRPKTASVSGEAPLSNVLNRPLTNRRLKMKPFAKSLMQVFSVGVFALTPTLATAQNARSLNDLVGAVRREPSKTLPRAASSSSPATPAATTAITTGGTVRRGIASW